MIRKCQKCGWEERPGEPLHEHHLIPQKGWEGTDREGRILLCNEHHRQVANYVLARVGKLVKVENVEIWKALREQIKSYTAWWCTV